MTWQWNSLVIPLTLGGLTSLVVAIIVWRRRSYTSSLGSILLIAASLWIFGSALEVVGGDLHTKEYWAQFQYLGISIVPSGWLIYTLRFTGHDRKLSPLRLALLLIIPFLTLIFALTNDYFGFMWPNAVIQLTSPFIKKSLGIWNIVFLAHAYIMLGMGVILMASMLVREGRLYRWQAIAFVITVLAPWLANAFFDQMGLAPVREIELTPFVLGITLPAMAWGLYRLRSRDLGPVARDIILENMRDAVISLDAQGNISDLNLAASELIGKSTLEVTGLPLEQGWPLLWAKLNTAQSDSVDIEEIDLFNDDVLRTFDVSNSPISGINDQILGRVIVLRDVTGRERIEKALALKAKELSRSNALITSFSRMAARMENTLDPDDMLDGLGTEFADLGMGCMVWELDREVQSLRVRYISVDNSIIRRIEKLLGLSVQTFCIPKDNWEKSAQFKKIISRNSSHFNPDPLSTMHEFLPKFPRFVIEQVFELTRIKTTIVSAHLPLRGKENLIGTLTVWGSDLQENDLSPLSVFASQIANHLERAQLFEKERQRSEELKRADAFTTALSHVSAQLVSTEELDHVLDILGTELAKLNISVLIALQDADTLKVLPRYLSGDSSLITKAEKFSGLTFEKFSIPKDIWPFSVVLQQDQAVFAGNTGDVFHTSLPNLQRSIIKKLLELMGIDFDTPSIYLPLQARENIIGIMVVWGQDLQDTDVDRFIVFARQIAAILQKTKMLAELQSHTEHIQASLDEKEVMLQEIHHRVKNNLQIVSSLLRLQSYQADDPRVLENLRDGEQRVHMMALIHEKLYQSENFSRISFENYLPGLIDDLFQIYSIERGMIVLHLDVQDVNFDIDTAIPFGLIINELISNALKHAFPSGRCGEVRVQLKPTPDGGARFLVADNGIGLPNDFDIKSAKSLGLQLVDALLRQLNGTIQINRTQGTEIEIQI